MNKLNCIVVDDEPLAVNFIARLLQQIPFLNIAATFNVAVDALHYVSNNTVDLLFLDVQMPGLNGLDLARSLKNKEMIIFTTAFDEYAIEGFNISAVDYVLKPIDKERLLAACNKALLVHEWNQLKQAPKNIFINAQHRVIKINTDSILYVEGLKDYVKIYLEGETKALLTRMNLKGIAGLLPEQQFKRIHKSYIVNTKRIGVFEADAVYIGKLKLPLGSAYKTNLKQF